MSIAQEKADGLDGQKKSIKRALPYCQRELPPAKALLSLPEEEAEGWLNHIAIFRARGGLSLCYTAVKNCDRMGKGALAAALFALEKIEVHALDKSGKRWLTAKLKAILSSSSMDEEVKIEAAKALFRLEQNPRDKEVQELLFAECKRAVTPEQREAFVELLGSFDCEENEAIIGYLIALVESSSEEETLKRKAALALSRIPHREGLLAALRAVRSPLRSPYEAEYAAHCRSTVGSFDLFMHIPEGMFYNRKALSERIVDRLVEIELRSPAFRKEAEKALERYRGDKGRYPEIERAEKCYVKERCVRWIGAPLYFPEKSFLARAIGLRKGEKPYWASFVDLLLKGCGSCDLTAFETEEEGGATGARRAIYSPPMR